MTRVTSEQDVCTKWTRSAVYQQRHTASSPKANSHALVFLIVGHQCHDCGGAGAIDGLMKMMEGDERDGQDRRLDLLVDVCRVCP